MCAWRDDSAAPTGVPTQRAPVRQLLRMPLSRAAVARHERFSGAPTNLATGQNAFVGHDKWGQRPFLPQTKAAAGLRRPHTPFEGVLFSPPAKLRPAARRTTIMILAHDAQHLDAAS
jgi:hypothetical protein